MFLEILTKIVHAVIFILSILLVGIIAYNLSLFLVATISSRRHGRLQLSSTPLKTISLIIPLKDEFSVLQGLTRSILDIDYPAELFEVIFVTPQFSEQFLEKSLLLLSRDGIQVKIVVDEGRGKPAALNLGLKVAVGETVGIFDADSILPSNILRRVSEIFMDEGIVAIQGITKSYNDMDNILSKLISIEQEIYFRVFLKPRSSLNLFIPFTGSCLFIKRDFLLRIGGWDTDSLTEDFDLALRLYGEGAKVRLEPAVYCWQEAPSMLRSYIIQRVRWFRGFIQLIPRNLYRLTSLEGFDIFLMLLGPVILSTSLLIFMYLLISDKFVLFPLLKLLANLVGAIAIPSLICLVLKPRSLNKTLIFIAGIIGYWILESSIATMSVIMGALGLKIKWVRTPKTGVREFLRDRWVFKKSSRILAISKPSSDLVEA
jgi:cellulose synthase/poly-beta-1,6-N-acetylglucosamine synthase-like glycosyltransferase